MVVLDWSATGRFGEQCLDELQLILGVLVHVVGRVFNPLALRELPTTSLCKHPVFLLLNSTTVQFPFFTSLTLDLDQLPSKMYRNFFKYLLSWKHEISYSRNSDVCKILKTGNFISCFCLLTSSWSVSLPPTCAKLILCRNKACPWCAVNFAAYCRSVSVTETKFENVLSVN